jgi:membrane associated rhomboid family serine protease
MGKKAIAGFLGLWAVEAFAKGGSQMAVGSMILLLICAVVLIPLLFIQATTFTHENAMESQKNMVIDTDADYHVVWHKHNGGFIRGAIVKGNRLKAEVEKTFNRSKDTYIFFEITNGYSFIRLNMQGGNRMRQKFGGIKATRIG